MGEFSPGFDGSSVEGKLADLTWCARVFGFWLCFVVASTVAVVECDVAY